MKKFVFFIILKLRERKFKQIRLSTWQTDRLVKYGFGYARQGNRKGQKSSNSGYGVASHQKGEDMEEVQKLGPDPNVSQLEYQFLLENVFITIGISMVFIRNQLLIGYQPIDSISLFNH